MAEMREKSAVNNLRSKKLLTQDNRGRISGLSFLTVTQCLQLPSSKVSKMMIIQNEAENKNNQKARIDVFDYTFYTDSSNSSYLMKEHIVGHLVLTSIR